MTNIIRYRNVELRRQELTVLKNVNLEITQGNFVFLIGKVGSGKSTLLKSFYAETPIAEGEANVMEYDLTRIKRRQVPFLRRNIGFVFQDFQLLTDRNVQANLDFVLRATGWKSKPERDERIERVLNSVGMAKKYYKMPYELSGGEQQRIAIARALLNNPSLILADEPTGNLDPETGDHIMGLLHDISGKGTAVVIATHNLGFLQKFPATVLSCANKKIDKSYHS